MRELRTQGEGKGKFMTQRKTEGCEAEVTRPANDSHMIHCDNLLS